jgi:glycosyltransferase involved in cell wall biosynthesis
VKISIAMCTYNGARYLREFLDSILAQSLLPYEVVVCDDGSIDETLEILEGFREQAPFVVRIVRNSSNLGYSRNFAKAIDLCVGEIVALADQDDIWYPNKLKRFADVFNADASIEGVFSDGDVIDETSQPVGRSLWESFLFDSKDVARFHSGEAVDTLLRRNVVTGMAFAFRSSAKDVLPSMPSSWIHDGWIAIQIAMRSRLVPVPERLVGYRVHGTQQIGTPLTLSGKVAVLRQRGPMAYLKRVRTVNLDEYQRTARQFDDLAASLEAIGGDKNLEAKIRAKAAHAHRGARALTRGRLRRLLLLPPHIADYAKFSPNGIRGLLRDLVA